jgi:large subunit ribosomal protein L7/L12
MFLQNLSRNSVENMINLFLKGAYVQESVYVGDNMLDALVSVKTKQELIGDIIMLLQSPAKNVISALQSGGTKFMVFLKHCQKEKNKLKIIKFKINKMADLKKFAEELVNLSVKEVNELAKILKDEYGIEPAAAAVAVAGPAAGNDAPVVEEKSTFDVILKAAGGQKLQIVNLLRISPVLDLKKPKQ